MIRIYLYTKLKVQKVFYFYLTKEYNEIVIFSKYF